MEEISPAQPSTEQPVKLEQPEKDHKEAMREAMDKLIQKNQELGGRLLGRFGDPKEEKFKTVGNETYKNDRYIAESLLFYSPTQKTEDPATAHIKSYLLVTENGYKVIKLDTQKQPAVGFDRMVIDPLIKALRSPQEGDTRNRNQLQYSEQTFDNFNHSPLGESVFIHTRISGEEDTLNIREQSTTGLTGGRWYGINLDTNPPADLIKEVMLSNKQRVEQELEEERKKREALDQLTAKAKLVDEVFN